MISALSGCANGIVTLLEVTGTLYVPYELIAKEIILSLDRRIPAKDLLLRASNSPSITIFGLAEIPVQHLSPNSRYFTVEDILNAVEETERQTRGNTEWFGEVDRAHIYLERIATGDGLVWRTSWGS